MCLAGTALAADSENPFRPVASVKELMNAVLDPAADVIWDSAGFVITAEGERDLQPQTPEGWRRVRDGALRVSESGNLLMLPGRSLGADWDAYAREMMRAGQLAMQAAAARDAAALFDAGGEVYEACRSCHQQYMLPPGAVVPTP